MERHLVDEEMRTGLLEAQQVFTQEFTAPRIGAALVAALGSTTATNGIDIKLPNTDKPVALRS
jgi:hypothetical protein